MNLFRTTTFEGFGPLNRLSPQSLCRAWTRAATRGVLAAGLLAGALQAQADTLSLPNAANGGTSESIYILSTSAATYQFLISHSQLIAMGPSAAISGISFRLRNSVSSSQPAADMTFEDFEIYMGPMASSFGSLNSTYANNLPNNSSKVQVKDGALTVTANSLAPTGTPGGNPTPAGPYGATISFPAYTYDASEGNGLVIEIRHTAGSGTAPLLDATISSGLGWGSSASSSLYAYRSTLDGMSATSGTAGGFASIQLTYTPVPEPSEYAAAAGIGLLAFAAWRRNRRQTNVVSA